LRFFDAPRAGRRAHRRARRRTRRQARCPRSRRSGGGRGRGDSPL